jgi:hypothetical protein
LQAFQPRKDHEMIRTSKPKRLRWRRKTAVALLAATAAMVGGGQALAPAPALAEINLAPSWGGCSELEASWFDQFCISDEPGGGSVPSLGGGGGGGTGGSSGSSGTKIKDDGRNEAIVITETKVKVPVGTRPDSSKTGSGAEPGNSGGPPKTTGSGRIPRCSKTVTENCRPPVVDCIASDGARRPAWSSEECDEFNKERELEAERKAKKEALMKARRPAFCKFLRAQVKNAEDTLAAFDRFVEVDSNGAVIHHGPKTSVDPDMKIVTDAYIKALKDLAEGGCPQS